MKFISRLIISWLIFNGIFWFIFLKIFEYHVHKGNLFTAIILTCLIGANMLINSLESKK